LFADGRFASDGLNIGFRAVFNIVPFVAIRSVLRLRGWAKMGLF
jgi:hypothetical protein